MPLWELRSKASNKRLKRLFTFDSDELPELRAISYSIVKAKCRDNVTLGYNTVLISQFILDTKNSEACFRFFLITYNYSLNLHNSFANITFIVTDGELAARRCQTNTLNVMKSNLCCAECFAQKYFYELQISSAK